MDPPSDGLLVWNRASGSLECPRGQEQVRGGDGPYSLSSELRPAGDAEGCTPPERRSGRNGGQLLITIVNCRMTLWTGWLES